jgi:hypothetical protein
LAHSDKTLRRPHHLERSCAQQHVPGRPLVRLPQDGSGGGDGPGEVRGGREQDEEAGEDNGTARTKTIWQGTVYGKSYSCVCQPQKCEYWGFFRVA